MRRVERSDNYFLVDLRKLHSFAIDRLVENLVIVELKCVELFSPYTKRSC
jgi:hypothetical protein